LALFQKSVGAENDPAGVPKPNEPEAAYGFELKQPFTEGVDLLFILGEAMVAGVIEGLGEFGELLEMECRSLGEEVFRRAIRSVGEQLNSASRTGLVEERFHGNN
jgi:hypothetical protein